MGNNYGYARVSTKEQYEDRQIVALREMCIPKRNIYIDKESGKDFNRECYKKLIRRIKSEDVLYVKSIDRLGRSYEDIIEQWKLITKERKAATVDIQ